MTPQMHEGGPSIRAPFMSCCSADWMLLTADMDAAGARCHAEFRRGGIPAAHEDRVAERRSLMRGRIAGRKPVACEEAATMPIDAAGHCPGTLRVRKGRVAAPAR